MMAKIIVKDKSGRVWGEWTDGDDWLDAADCVRRESLGIDLPREIWLALKDALKAEALRHDAA